MPAVLAVCALRVRLPPPVPCSCLQPAKEKPAKKPAKKKAAESEDEEEDVRPRHCCCVGVLHAVLAGAAQCPRFPAAVST